MGSFGTGGLLCCSAGFDQVSDGSKQITEVMPHPAAGDADDRDAYASPMHPMMAQPSASLVGGPDFDPEPEVVEHGPTREIGVQVSLSSLFKGQMLAKSCCCNDLLANLSRHQSGFPPYMFAGLVVKTRLHPAVCTPHVTSLNSVRRSQAFIAHATHDYCNRQWSRDHYNVYQVGSTDGAAC